MTRLVPVGSPGCAVGIYDAGLPRFLKGYGLANLELGQAITPNTVFYLASTAKQFAAYAIWDLALSAKLSIDDDIRRFIPELPSYGKPITIRHLLHHTSGLRDYIDIFQEAGIPGVNLKTSNDVLSAILRQHGVNYQPGEKFQYTNTNFVLLAEIVARVTGASYPEYIRSHIFRPLGMTSSRIIEDNTTLVPQRASSYLPQANGYVNVSSNWVILGAAGIFSNVEDLARWDANFYNATGHARAVLDSMQVTGIAAGAPITYASGLWVDRFRGLRVVRHSGSSLAYRSELLRFPDQRVSLVVLCNTTTEPRAPELADRLSGFVLDSVFQRTQPAPAAITLLPSVVLSEDQLKPILGDYWDPKTGVYRRMTYNRNVLRYVIDSWSSSRLTPLSPNHFRFGASELTITPTGQMRVQWYDGRDETYERLQRPHPTRTELSEYAGEFTSEDLETTYQVVTDSTAMTLKRPNQEDRRLVMLAHDVFSEGDIHIRYLRDARKRIVKLLFTDNDFVDIEFKKREN